MRMLRTMARAAMIAMACSTLPARGAGVELVVGDAAGRAPGDPSAAVVNEPFATAFDPDGNLWGVEFTRGNRVFRLVTPPAAGARAVPEFVAGEFHVSDPKRAEPAGAAADAARVRFNGLHDLAIGPDGTVWLADTFNHRIRALDPANGTLRTIAGTGAAGFSGDGGPAALARFDQPYCVSLVPGGAALLVADIGNARLRSIDLASGVVTTIAGDGTKGKPVDGAVATRTALAGPRAACAGPDGTVWLALREGNALVEIRGGTVRVAVNASGRAGFGGDGGPGREALLAGPKYVATDARGRVLVCDTENHCIRRYDPASGTIGTVAGVPGEAGTAIGATWRETHLDRPHAARIDAAGRLVVADSGNDRILAGPLD